MIQEYNLLDGDLHNSFISYYSNGNTEVKLNFQNGILEGLGYFYDANGNKLQILRFLCGELHGRYLSFKNGKLLSYSFFKEGKLHGMSKTFYENRALQSVLNYNFGLLDGRSIFYDQKGNMIQSTDYVDGALHGDNIIYTQNGTVYKIEKFEHGNLLREVL